MSGNIPFADLNYGTLVQAVYVREERPPMHPQTSKAGLSYTLLWILAARCWSQSPEARPPMEEARDAIATTIDGPLLLSAMQDDLPVLLAPVPPEDVAAHKRRRTDSKCFLTSLSI